MIKENSNYYDLCVIGSGPAGIIVALEYSKLNPEKKILLVEYGEHHQPSTNKLDDSILITNPVNHHDPYECTNKGLGGTSATWGGRCVMYDEVDFIDRPILNGNCTWGTDLFNETQKYIAKAANYFECGEPLFDLKDISAFSDTKIADNFVNGDVTDTVVERWSMPTRFGDRYKNELAQNKNITLMMGYEARTFSDPDEDGKVKTLKLRNVSNGDFTEVEAVDFVLSAGTQESTRILLRNLNLFKLLDKVPVALGKYYQSHITGKIASVIFYGDAKNVDFSFLRNEDGTYIKRRFQFSSKFLVDNNLLNTALWLDNPLYFDPVHKSGAMSFMYLAMITPFLGKKLAPPAIAQSITKGKKTGISKHILNIIKDFPGSLITPFSIFYKRYCVKRKLPGVFLYSKSKSYALHFHGEQVPSNENEMKLGDDGEQLIINYGISKDDIDSVIKLHDKLDKWLRDCNCGEVKYWYDRSALYDQIKKISKDGIHQSGTTRIAGSADEGVVDTNLRLFGTSNVYVCSSSVFPTSGQANPTFYLGTFAVRLADYLSGK